MHIITVGIGEVENIFPLQGGCSHSGHINITFESDSNSSGGTRRFRLYAMRSDVCQMKEEREKEKREREGEKYRKRERQRKREREREGEKKREGKWE